MDDFGGKNRKNPIFGWKHPNEELYFLATPKIHPSPSQPSTGDSWPWPQVMSAILSALSKPVVWQRLGPVFGGRVFVFFFQEQKHDIKESDI